MAGDWQRIRPLLERALELDAEERRAFLEEARAGDEALLERAEAGFEAADMALHAACARRRLGQVIGGDEGRTLIAAANEWMRGQEIKNPERMAAMIAPGRWPPA